MTFEHFDWLPGYIVNLRHYLLFAIFQINGRHAMNVVLMLHTFGENKQMEKTALIQSPKLIKYFFTI